MPQASAQISEWRVDSSPIPVVEKLDFVSICHLHGHETLPTKHPWLYKISCMLHRNICSSRTAAKVHGVDKVSKIHFSSIHYGECGQG